MKKLGLTIGFCLVMVTSFGQKKNVTDALKISKDSKGNIEEARAKIKSALQHPDTKDDAKTWFTAGQVENNIFDRENTKQILGQKPNEVVMYNALYDIYPYFVKAYDLDQLPDAKNRVRPKYVKDIRTIMKANSVYYINGGVYFYEKEDYKRAYEIWDQFVEINNSVMMTEGGVVNEADSNYIWANFYAAIAATMLEDNTLTISTLKRASKFDYRQNEVFQWLIGSYQMEEDTENMEKTLLEAVSVFPNEAYFISTLALLYIDANKHDKAIDFVLSGIKNDPTKAEYHNIAGFIYEIGLKDLEKAEGYYLRTIELDSENPDTQASTGRLYYNQGVTQLDVAGEVAIADVKKYNEEREKARVFFRKALPFFEKSIELNPNQTEILIRLRSIYYHLDMGDKMDEITKVLGDD